MIEIERKFRITPTQKRSIETRLQQHISPLPKMKHQIDEVFLHDIQSFKHFVQGMPVVRLRTEDGNTQLTYKRRLNDAGDALEHELTIGSADAMRSILTEMGYHSVTIVDKRRREVQADGVTLVLDDVKDVGNFLEIEVLTDDAGNLEDGERRIMTMAATFGLTEADIELRKYDQLVAQL